MRASTGDSTIQEESREGPSERAPAGWLAVIACPEAEQVGVRAPIGGEEAVLIGRKVERGGLRLEDPKLSRVHARVVWDGRVGAFRVGDENSANGTSVDGGRTAVATLEHGSVVRVGDRSEERRVGKECMVQCRSRWSPYH